MILIVIILIINQIGISTKIRRLSSSISCTISCKQNVSSKRNIQSVSTSNSPTNRYFLIMDEHGNLNRIAVESITDRAEIYTDTQLNAYYTKTSSDARYYTRTELDDLLADKEKKDKCYSKLESDNLLSKKISYGANAYVNNLVIGDDRTITEPSKLVVGRFTDSGAGRIEILGDCCGRKIHINSSTLLKYDGDRRRSGMFQWNLDALIHPSNGLIFRDFLRKNQELHLKHVEKRQLLADNYKVVITDTSRG